MARELIKGILELVSELNMIVLHRRVVWLIAIPLLEEMVFLVCNNIQSLLCIIFIYLFSLSNAPVFGIMLFCVLMPKSI